MSAEEVRLDEGDDGHLREIKRSRTWQVREHLPDRVFYGLTSLQHGGNAYTNNPRLTIVLWAYGGPASLWAIVKLVFDLI